VRFAVMALPPAWCLIDLLICFSVMTSAVMAAMQTMQRDESKIVSFDVKPGAGSQQFNQELVFTINNIHYRVLLIHPLCHSCNAD